jgi:LuxR family transcriptional regulator of csgAB operon
MVADGPIGKVGAGFQSADEPVWREGTPAAEYAQGFPEEALPLENKHIYLVGSARAQSELLATHIERNTGVSCLLIEDLDGVAESMERDAESVLLMRDCYRKSNEMILAELQLVYQEKIPETLFCLFNLKANSGLELEAVEYGVKGFFYEHEPLENLVKGIYCVFQGEIWLTRKNMSEYIKKRSGPGRSRKGKPGESHLTQREVQILSMLAAGHSNDAIAETLFISRHTVKTHIYNIYKKIEVPDRLQAALWAAKNL